MIVVAQDAVPVDPQEVGSIQINNGQRYDVLVCRPNTTALSADPVWIKAVMIDDNFPTPSACNTSLGVLYYSTPGQLPGSRSKYNPPILTPLRRPVPGKVVNPYSLKPAGGVAPPPATRNILFVIDFYDGGKGTTQYVAGRLRSVAFGCSWGFSAGLVFSSLCWSSFTGPLNASYAPW